MKVCFVGLETLPIPPVKGGAIEKCIQEVSGHLINSGIQIHIISINDEKISGLPLNTDNHLRYHYVNIPRIVKKYPINRLLKGWSYFKKAGEIVNDINPDIIHYQNYPGAVLVASKQYSGHIKNILHIHNLDYGWNFLAKRMDRFLFKSGFKKTDAVITCSDFIKNFVLTKYPDYIHHKNISTLYNGVDTDIFKPYPKKDMRQELGICDEPLLLFAGRIDPRKGVHILLEAFREVKKEIKNVKLLIIGPLGSYWHNKPQDYALRIHKQASQIQDILFLKPEYSTHKLAKIFSAADIACIPSVFPEGFPLVALEIQACGIPVIGTDVGGLPETFIDKKTGVLIKQNDVAELAQTIISLIKDNKRKQSMSINARNFVEENFSWAVITKKLIKKYEDILNNK